jgi:hypothetical protein
VLGPDRFEPFGYALLDKVIDIWLTAASWRNQT